MKQYETFIFEAFSFDPSSGRIELTYALDDEISFTETLIVPLPSTLKPTEELTQALFALHLAGGVSYFKTCCPKTIEIRSGSLSPAQAEFWDTVYQKGLAEFCFKNAIDPSSLARFPSSPNTNPKPNPNPNPTSFLIPLGGGKDSIVTLELIKASGTPATLLRIGKHPLIEETARIAGLPLLNIDRRLSPELFRLNAEGALNGHVPITAYLSMLSIVTGLLHGHSAVVMSNERSASEGNLKIDGREVNHQWSKSLEFEGLFRDYLAACITRNVEYFSLLRPLSELTIAGRFSKHRKYFDVFTSCNTNWKLTSIPRGTRWCGECPKCAFAFALFAAFLPLSDLMRIFGKNLFHDVTLLPLYRQLFGLEGWKPFECVGTPEETSAALLLAIERGELLDTPVIQMFTKDLLPKFSDPRKLIRDARETSPAHFVPDRFHALLG